MKMILISVSTNFISLIEHKRGAKLHDIIEDWGIWRSYRCKKNLGKTWKCMHRLAAHELPLGDTLDNMMF